jgi:hypothetical protein
MRKNKNGGAGLNFLSTGLSFAGLILLGTTGARASLINYEFQGQVLGGGVNNRTQVVDLTGQHVTGFLSFDPNLAMPITDPATPPQNFFWNGLIPGYPHLEFSIGQYHGIATGTPGALFQKDRFVFSDMALSDFHGPLGSGSGNIDFTGFGQGIFGADPTTSLSGGHWDRVTGGEFGGGPVGYDFQGNFIVNVTDIRLEGSSTCP